MKRKNRKLKQLPCFILLSLIVAFIFQLSSIVSAADEKITDKNYSNFIIVTVKTGENLWSLAQKHNANCYHLDKLIYEIRQVNQLPNSQIYPGQQLTIPISKHD